MGNQLKVNVKESIVRNTAREITDLSGNGISFVLFNMASTFLLYLVLLDMT